MTDFIKENYWRMIIGLAVVAFFVGFCSESKAGEFDGLTGCLKKEQSTIKICVRENRKEALRYLRRLKMLVPAMQESIKDIEEALRIIEGKE